MFRFRRLVLNAAADPAPGGAADPKKDERPVPPPAPPRAEAEPPPPLPADALSELSRRTSALENRKPVSIGAGAVLAIALVAALLVGGVFFVVAAVLRARREAPENG